MSQIDVTTTPSTSDISAVLRCAAAATAHDGSPPLSDQTLLQISRPETGDDTPGTHLLARGDTATRRGDGEVVGYGFATTGEAELVVHPDHRRVGHGRALLTAALEHAPRNAGALRLWAHGEHPGAVRLAAKFGLTRDRILCRMERSLHGADLTKTLAAAPPESVRLRTFVPGQDEAAWLSLNRRAFAGHSEQAALTPGDLLLRETQPWFDAAGFLLAERASDGALLGAHWTKVHPGRPNATQPVGEVYVLSVDPDAHGGGLGKVLLAAGLSYLRQRGLDRVMLYVDADNTAAVALYTKLGFTQASVDVQYLSAP